MTEEASRDESLLIRRCAEGDEVAWAAFVDRFGPLLTNLARRFLARHGTPVPPEDVDEVVAEVFLSLLRRDRVLLERYDARWRVSTYLGVICRTAALRLVRRRSRRGAALDRPEDVPAAAPDTGGPFAELTGEEREAVRRRLEAGLAALGRRDRLILKLRFLDGLDYRAIAEALDVSPESVGSLLSRAKRRLASRVPDLDTDRTKPGAEPKA